MIIEILIFLSVLLFLLTKFNRRPSSLPPGEWGFPVIGYLPQMGESAPAMVKRLHAKHGQTFCTKFGTRLFIYISDYETIKSTFGKHEFSGRFDMYSLKIFYFFKDLGIFFTSGLAWDTNRKFALKVLKHFGLGKSKLEETVKIEAEILVDDLRKKVGLPIKIDWSLNVAILNVIWTLVADKRYDHGDQEIQNFSEMVDESVNSVVGPTAILDLYPCLIPFMPNFVLKLMKVDRRKRIRDALYGFINKIITEHASTLDENNLRDYIDMYLIEIANQEKDNNQSTATERSLLDLSASIFDLFVAGTETSSNALRWYFLYMAKYPEIQKRIQLEIDSAVPKDRLPSLEDKNKLSYFEATTHELLRKVSLTPFGVPHGAVEDGLIDGYEIPKGTAIISSIEVCHNSSKYWDRPSEFYPEHFLNEEGKFYIRKEGFLPFSLGRRQCLGESLSKLELFIFMGAILQNFTISEPNDQNATLEPCPGTIFFNKAQNFNVILTKR